MDKKKVSKEGIDKSYKLAFGHLDNLIRRRNKKEEIRWIKLAERAFLHRPFLRYEEFFDSNEVDTLITEQNEIAVNKLNTIVDSLNQMRLEKNTNHDELSNIWNDLRKLL